MPDQIEFPIMFEDLSPKAQEDLLAFQGVKSPSELNWDVFPVATIYREID
jgi:hypothetical protein